MEHPLVKNKPLFFIFYQPIKKKYSAPVLTEFGDLRSYCLGTPEPTQCVEEKDIALLNQDE